MAEQKDLSLSNPALSSEICAAMEKSNAFSEEKRFDESTPLALKSWAMLPEPKREWDLSGWITDSLFQDYFATQDLDSAKKWAMLGIECKNDMSTSEFINMGMVCLELNQQKDAYENFHKAYAYGKSRAFQGRPRKYLDFYLKTASARKNKAKQDG